MLHPRMRGDPPLRKGPLAGKSVPIGDMIRGYWKALGWDETTGAPTRETRTGLGLDLGPEETGR